MEETVPQGAEEVIAKGASPEAKEATAKARPWQPVNPEKEGALESLERGTSRSGDNRPSSESPAGKAENPPGAPEKESLPEEGRFASGRSPAKANRSEESRLSR